MECLLRQNRTIDAQGAWTLAPARASPLCSWFLTLGAISSLEAVPLQFHNFCRNNCWQRHRVHSVVPPAAYQGIHAELSGRAAWAGGAGSACSADPALNWQNHLGALPLSKRQALQSHFHQLSKLLFYSTNLCP